MKKSRILRALKKHDAKDLNKNRVFSFKDEKGKEYFLAEQPQYMNIITQAINTILEKTFVILNDDKLKDKILKGLNNEQK
jgi:hypothetical protein|tara:strand:- start:304 stop:543 length:240 start_codon:yes stop_codon:yes gene_type:complete